LNRAKSPESDGGAAPGRRLRQEGGFTLLETLIAAVVLIIGLMTLFGLLEASLKATTATRQREGASNLARQVLEDARTIPYGQISPGAIQTELQEMHGLADSSSTTSGWQVVQRGVTYTVSVSDCSIDDPKDGFGVHENAFKENPFCSESSTIAAADTQPEDLKRIEVDVTWTVTGRKPKVHQVETLTAAGEAPGLNASGLRLVAGQYSGEASAPIVTSAALATLNFEVSAPASAKATRWSLDGVVQSPAPTLKSGTTTTWIFSWSIPVASVTDGTYEVSAQAIDGTGVVGPAVALPVTLLRSTPAAVTGIKGGFNEIYVNNEKRKVVELEWKANTERNVIGYRVYDPSPPGSLVCPESLSTLSVALSCIDMSPPAPAAANLTYSAYALYRNTLGELAQGAAGAFAVSKTVEGPNPPLTLEATKQAEGSVLLKWSAPATTPQAITFYRVYRGSKNYTSRYDVVPAGTTTYTDTSAAVEHEYWVTAVDANFTESAFLGPVTK
jgi:Tfp pilus assembly protein PilV